MSGSVERLTPAGVGGVAVLAVRGARAEDRLAGLFSRRLPAAGELAYGHLWDELRAGSGTDAATGPPDVGSPGTGVLDEVIVVRRVDGELEVHLHGSPATVREAVRLIGGEGDPGPQAGIRREASFEERARRAVHRAPTGLGARILLDQAAGALRSELEALRPLDGPDRARALARLGRAGAERRRLFEPATIVLTGHVNAGKSTLFNALVGRDAATVTDVPGTTRDALAERARLGPWPVLLVDTAGMRDLEAAVAAGRAEARVERAGQQLALEAAARADLVFELVPFGPAGDGDGAPAASRPDRAPASHATGAPRVRLSTRAAPVLGADPAAWGPGALSALEDPAHARRTVLSEFIRALGLPGSEVELWRAGAGVPCERGLLARIVELGRSPEVSIAALDALLADL